MSGKPQASVPSLRQAPGHPPASFLSPPRPRGAAGGTGLYRFFFLRLQLLLFVHHPPPVPVVSRCRNSPLPLHPRRSQPFPSTPPLRGSPAFPFSPRVPGSPQPLSAACPGLCRLLAPWHGVTQRPPASPTRVPPRPRGPRPHPGAGSTLPAPAPIGCGGEGRGLFVTSRSAVGRCRFVRGSGARSAEPRGPQWHRPRHRTGTTSAPSAARDTQGR